MTEVDGSGGSGFRTGIDTGAISGYAPSEEDLRGLAEWFARYDGLSATADVARMAEQGVFPMNLVTDDGAGRPWCAQWDRGQYVRTMTQVMGGGSGGAEGEGGGEVSFRSERTPFFLSSALVVVFSRSTMTAGGETHALDYADVLVREEDGWRFQTMVQSGWGELLRQQAGGGSPG